MKHPRLGAQTQSLFSHRFGSWKSKIRGLESLISPGSLSLACRISVSSCGLSSSYKDTSQDGLGPYPMTSFILNYLLKSPVSK
jgi:hypothetical protein